MTKFTLRMLAGLMLLASLFFSFGIAQANAATANCPAGTANGLPSNVVTDNTSYYEFDLNAGTCSAINNGTTPSSPLHGLSFSFYNFHTSGTNLYVQVNNPDQPHDGGFTNVALSGTNLNLQSGSPGGYFYDCSSGCTIGGFNTTDVNGNTISVSAITITQSGAYSISPFTITYVVPPIPAVTSISPSSGVSNGGTSVVITGTGFVNVSSVSIGGSPVKSFSVVSSTQINAVTEAHAVAAGVSVDVSNANGSNAANTLFTYTVGTCSAGTSATLSMLGTALNVNQAFNVDTLLGVSPSVPGSGGIYVTCAADTTLYPPNDASQTTPGSISITGASGGVYTLGYDLTHITADDLAGTYPHYVLKVTTAPPAGTDTLTTYYYSGAGVGGPYGPPTDKTFVIHLTNVVTVGPTMIANAGTTPQSATVNTAFANALAVTVKDASNNPQSGVNVIFTAPGSGASGTFSNSTNTITVATNASGIASAPFSANATAGGPYTVTAAAAGFTTVNFSMTNTPITMAANPGTTPQSATISTAFTNPLAVTVKDAGSNPVSGVNVTFTAPSSGTSGKFSNSTNTIIVATNASGIASAPFTANTSAGPYTVTAAASGVATVNFSMTNTPGAPSTMTAQPGSTPQSATINTAFTNNLSVLVKDVGNNTVSGVSVTFTAPSSGASGTFSNSTNTITVATNAFGIAFEPFTANATAGGPYTVTAAASGLTTVNFSMTNAPGAPSSMTANAGTTPQSATISTAFTNALGVTVKDVGNNPISGVNVTFTAPGSGASGKFSNSTATIIVATNASGVASAPITANATAGGPYNVTAAASGLTTVNFSMTNTQAAQTITFGANPGPLTYSPAGTFAVSATGGASGNPVTFASSTAAVCTISGSTVSIVSAGTCTIAANQAGNASYTAAPQVSQNITINQAAQTITFGANPGPVTYTPGGTFTVSATGGASGNAVTFASTTTGVCTVSGSTVSMVTGGTCTITADQAGNSNYTAAPQVSQNIAINQAAQTITFGANPGPLTYSPAGTFAVSATGGASGNPVTFASSTAAVCTISGSTVSIVSAGTCTIAANQAGNASYTAAPQVSQNITINQAAQTITFGANPGPVTYTPGGTFTVSATGGASGNAVTFASTTTGVCTVSGSTVSMVTGGTCTITADQAGNSNYTAAPQVSQNIAINQAAQTITFGANPGPLTYSPAGTFAVSATGGASGNPVTFASSTAAVCSISGSTVSIVSAGTCTIAANQAGNASYTAAPQVSQNITINQAAQTIAFTPPATQTYTPGGTVALSATGGASGNPVTFASTTTGICTTGGSNGATVTFVSAGACNITASQAGNANYFAAADVAKSFTINQAAQAITFGANPGPLTYSPAGTFAVSATGGASGNPVTFASSTAAVCTISGSTVSIVSAGTCTIAANQAGNASYTAAPQVSQNITINQAAQTITFTSTPPAVVAAGGMTYTVAATGGASGNAVTFMIDGTSGAGVCSIAGSTVSFLKSGTCIVDANQQGTTSYAPAPQVQQTILVQNGVGPTVAAIAGFLSDRNNAIVTNMWNMDSTIDRLNDAPGGGGPGTGLTDQPAGQPQTTLRSGLLANQNSSQSGTVIPALTSPASGAGMQDFLGLQQMVYGALRQLGETQGVNQLNYSGPFSAQMSTSGDMTGTFHTSLSQIMKWNDQVQQKEAASMGLNTSGAAGAHQFNPLDVWMQGTYAAINSTQQAKFGLISSGVDYVFNRNLLLGFYGQVDFMNQTTGLQAGGTGWLVGPYGTMRLTDQIFLEARAGYGHSANAMTDALDPTLTDQFGSTRWLASAALAGRWNFGDHVGFKPNLSFTYFTDTTDAYVNGLSVAIPSVTSQLGQLKFSPEVTKGFSLGDANWYEASVAPELIYNFTSTTADGLGAVDPTATGPQGLRGAIKWGVSMKTPSGLTISTQGSYDGIGASGYSAITGEARVNVPLN